MFPYGGQPRVNTVYNSGGFLPGFKAVLGGFYGPTHIFTNNFKLSEISKLVKFWNAS